MPARKKVSAPLDPGDALARYWAKRDFNVTAEPRGGGEAAGDGRTLSFVVQKHWASRLHYDFRLELDGVLLSWAVPKGPSYDPADKPIAIHVEDHPLSYGSFEGTIPKGQYGAGRVIVWDRGTWEPVGDPHQGMKDGKLVFHLHGHKLQGLWELVRIAKPGDKQEPWILFKKRDARARAKAQYDVLSAMPDSVLSGPGAVGGSARAAVGGAGRGAVGGAGSDALLDSRLRGNDGSRSVIPAKAGIQEPTTRKATQTAIPAKAGIQGSPKKGDDNLPPGAIPAPLPAKLTPQLPTLASAAPTSGDWLWEIKFDGYRILARIEGARVQLITRGGHDWSSKMPALVQALADLHLGSAWLDGEIVVLGEQGTPDFGLLQNAMDKTRSTNVDYFLFDVPYLEGYDLRRVPLAARRQLLHRLLADRPQPRLRFSEAFDAAPAQILESARRMGLEGVMAKRTDAPYESRRTETWLKLKNKQRQEFVVAGYTDRSSGEAEVGALVLAVYDEADAASRKTAKTWPTLRYVGNVGTGWDAATAAALKKQLAKLEVATSPLGVQDLPRGRWGTSSQPVHWVLPRLVAEVAFSDWTSDQQLRHAVFVAMRDDKPATEIRRERAVTPAGATLAPRGGASAVEGIAVSNPERVIDAASGVTKLELVRYYASVAAWMLPHLKGRPTSLVRGPQGVGGELFYQKHLNDQTIPGVRELPAGLWPGHAPLLELPSAKALVAAAQMNVIELHTWNATAGKIETPDRVIFDLDPGEGVAWERMQEAALLVRELLKELRLQCWLKTSGGKGLHLVVPLAPRERWDAVRAFSEAVVQHMATVIPQRFVAKSGPANRVGRIFVDYLRNTHGATTAAAYSARSRPGLGVSMPIAWDDLAGLQRSDQWTVRTAREHLSFQQVDPWADYWKCRQTLVAGRKALGLA